MITAYFIIGAIIGLIIGLPFILLAILIRVGTWLIVRRRHRRRPQQEHLHEAEAWD